MPNQSGRLAGKVAVVTGGASGIGASICRRFAEQGGTIVIADVNQAAGDLLAAELTERGGKAVNLVTNVADLESVAATVDHAVSRYGGLDVMVNNAGIGSQTSGDRAGWWRLMQINVLGVAWGMREAVGVMREHGGGAIVNTGSQAALRSARHGVYGSSKAAVHALTRYAALVHAVDGVRVNAVLPGNIYTPIHDMRRHNALVSRLQGDQRAFEHDPLDSGDDPREAREQLIDAFRAIHPLGRLTTTDDVADAAAYLASDEAAAVTGNEFLANGGVMAHLLAGRVERAGWLGNPEAPPPPTGTVAVVSTSDRLVAALEARIRAEGLGVSICPPTSLLEEESLSRWLAGVDRLAGVVFGMRPDPGGDLFSQDGTVWTEELQVDLRAPWVLGHRAVDLLPPGGAITFIADAAGATGASASPAYCATAAALAYATEDLAELLRSGGRRVNTVVVENVGATAGSRSVGAPASAEDVAELALSLMRSTRLTGVRMELTTSHPDDRPNL